ncbi:MAG: hypothetical protein JJU45_08095 [Acidimicrobiia bacterium]|nr:hypothetical protein [Acidimicrobiia bacterium]
MEASQATEDEWVWGVVDGSAIFLPRDRAEERQALGNSLGARTWGEFREALSDAGCAYLYEDLVEELVELDELPGDDEPFDQEMAPGLIDQCGPFVPVGTVMIDSLPEVILEEHGTYHEPMMAAPFLTIDETDAPGVVAALANLGMPCSRDDELLQQIAW